MNMKKNNYVLIVRDKSSNSYSPIWYNMAEELCNENDVRIRLNSLEKIDSFTMNFGSSEELNEYLCTNCMTESRDSDIFIACSQHHKDKDEITFLEPILFSSRYSITFFLASVTDNPSKNPEFIRTPVWTSVNASLVKSTFTSALDFTT